MNKIYKVIWSKVKHQYVVVSELAHSNGKQSRTSRNSIRSRIAALVVCGAIAAFGVFNALPNSAYAADSDYIAFVTTEKGQNANENQGDTIQINGYKYTSTRIAKPDNSYTWYWVRDGYNIQLERLERPGSDGSKDYVVRAFKDGGGEVETSLVHSYQNKIEDTGVTTLNGKNLHSYEAGVYAGGSNGYTAVRMEDKWSEADQTFKPNNDPMIFDGKEWRQAERTDFKDVKFNEETGNYEYNGQIVATENLYVVDFVKTKGNDTEVEGTKLGCFVVDGKVYTGTVHGKNNEILMTGINEDNKYVTYWASEYTDEKATMAQMPISQYKETISGLASDINAIHQDDIKEIQINQIDNGGSINLQTNGEFVPARDEKGDIITDETGKPVYVAQGGKNIPGGITIRNTTNSGSEGNDVAVEISNDKNSFTVDAGSKVVGKITTKNGVEEAGVGDANKTLTGLKINGVDYALSQGKTYSNGNGISIDEENNKISVNAGDGLTFGTEQTNDKGKLKVNVGDGLSIADGKVVNNLAISGEVTDQNKNGGNWTITDNKTGVKLTNTTLSSTVDKQSMTGNEYGNTYTISDTDGNTATLEDVASATKLSSVDSKIGELNYSSVTSEDNTIKDNDSVTTAIGKLDNKVNTGWTVADGNTENANFAVKPGETLTFNGDDNVTVEAKDHAVNVSLKDNITLGDKITLSGEDGKATIGGVKINNTYNDENGSITSSTIDGLTNKTWDSTENYSTSGKAATEAQLQAATDNISGKVNAGWKATAGETSIEVKPTKDEDGNNVVPTLNFAGDDNISVTADNTSSTIKVTLDPTLDVTSVDAKGTTISSAGLTVGGNTYVSSSGINANSKKITNVADGTIEKNSKDAVNAGQLYDVNQKVDAGWTATDGTNDIKVNPKDGTTTLKFAGDNNIAVTADTTNKAIQVALNDKVYLGGDHTEDSHNIVLDGDRGVIGLGSTIALDGRDGKAVIGSINIETVYDEATGKPSSTISGLANTTWDADLAAQGGYANSNKAATEAQIQSAVNQSGWTASTNKNVEGLAAKTDITNGDTVDFSNTDGNISVSQTAVTENGTVTGTDIKFDLNDNISLGDGKITLNGAPAEGEDLLNVDNKLVVAQDGTTTIAVNDGTVMGNNTTVTIGSDGVTFAGYDKGSTIIDGQTIQAGGVFINDGGNGQITRLTNTTLDDPTFATVGRAATEEQLQLATDAATTTVTEGKNIDVTSTVDKEDGHTNYEVKLQDNVVLGDNKITLNGNPGEDEDLLNVDNALVVGQDGTTTIAADNAETMGVDTRVTVNTDGVTFEGLENGSTIIDGQTIQAGGVFINDGGNGQITRLTNTTLNDPTFATVGRAATEEQLQLATDAATTTVTEGKNIDVTSTVDKEDGHTNYEVKLQDNVVLGDNKITLNGNPGEDEDLLNVDNALVVGQDGTTTIAADNAETMGVDTRVTVNTDGVTFEGLENGSTIIDGQTIQAGGVFINDGGNGQITRLTNTTLDDPTFATVGRAATEEQLQLATDAATTTVSEGKNIDVTSTVDEEDGHTDYEVSLQDNVSLGDGKITLNGAPAEGDDLLNVDNAFVVGQDGTTTITADDAGTMGADTKVTVGTDGVKFEGLENGTTTIDGQTIQAGGVFINDGGNGQITRLTNTTLDDPTFATVGRAATEEQLKQAAAASKTTLSDGVNTTVTSNDNTPDGHVDYQVNLNDNVYLGGNNKPGSSNIELDGENGTIQVGSNIILDSKEARAVIGGVDISTTFDDIGKKSSTITGLSNTTWDTDKVVIDRAATEGQLQMVSDKVTAGWTATDDAGNKINVNPETRPTLNFASGKNITVSANEDNGEVEVSLNDVVTLGDGEDAIKIDGTNGTLNIGSTFAVAEDGTVLSDGDVIADADGEKYSLSEVGKYAVRYDKTNDGTSTITLADGDDLSGTRIKNVADGVDPKDAVNVSQLEAVEATANAGWTASDGTNSISIKPNETLNFVGDENLTVSADGTDKKLKVSLNDDITLGNTEAGNTEGERSFTINTTDPNGYVPESYKTGSGANFIEENGGFMLFATDTQGFGVFGVTAKGSAWARDFKTYTTDIYGNNTQYSLNEVGDAVAQMSSYYNGKNSYTVFSRYLNEAEKDNPFVTVDEDGNTINATRDIPLALRDDGAVLIGATIKGEDFTDNGIRINAETKTTYDKNGNEVTNNIATITGLENTEWKPPTPVATFAANDGSATVTSRAATESQLNDLYSAVAAYDVNVDGTIDYSHIALAGTPYGASRSGNGTHTGGTSITNVAYASGNDGSEAVNVDYLNDAINNAVKDGGAISDSDRHLQEGTYHVNDQGKVELIVADEKGENQSTVTIDNIANKNDITNLDNKIDNTFNDLNDKINNIDNVETDVKGGNINEDGTISLKTENEDGTTTNVTLKGQLTDSGVVQEGTSFDKETGTITITSQDKYSGETSSVKVEGIASTEVVGATNKEDLATAYKDADKDGNATTEYITDSESMVEADVALDHAIQDVAGTSYANDMVLSNRIDSVEKRLGNVEERIDKVGAMAAAIANLRTMGFDPEAPTEIAIGVGQYKSETGIAIGVFHYPNQDFMLSASLSSSGDELMGGIGATWKLGRKSAAERAKDEEARHLEQAEEMKKLAQQEKVKAQAQRHAKLLAERQQASQKNA